MNLKPMITILGAGSFLARNLIQGLKSMTSYEVHAFARSGTEGLIYNYPDQGVDQIDKELDSAND